MKASSTSGWNDMRTVVLPHPGYVYQVRQCIVLMIAWCLCITPAAYGQTEGSSNPTFSGRIDCGVLDDNEINEASGIAASRRNPGVLWTHNDSGDDARVFAISTGGRLLAEFRLSGIDARDWEDIAIGSGPEDGVSYLYIGEIGDNSGMYPTKWVYRVPEPRVDSDSIPSRNVLTDIETIALTYPDHARDAETLMIDPATRDIFIVSKREEQVGIYRAPYPQATNSTSVLEQLGTLPFTMAVGGDISPDGTEILIKTYNTVYYWHRDVGESIQGTLSRPPETLLYIIEPQGEAICWDIDGRGYYTVSEKNGTDPVHLYYWGRDASQ